MIKPSIKPKNDSESSFSDENYDSDNWWAWILKVSFILNI